MATEMDLKQILVSDTPETGRIKINLNLNDIQDIYNSHINPEVEPNPHNMELDDINYTAGSFSDYAGINNALEGMNYAISQLRLHLSNTNNPHSLVSDQIELNPSVLTTSNSLNTVGSIYSVLDGLKYFYNKTEALSNAENINVAVANLSSGTLNSALNEISNEYANKNLNETISGSWNFINGANFNESSTFENVYVDNYFSFTNANNNVSFSDSLIEFDGQDVSIGASSALSINSTSSMSLVSSGDTEFTLNSPILNFTGTSIGGAPDIILNFQENSQFTVAPTKTLVIAGNRLSVETNFVDFSAPPKATYLPDLQLALVDPSTFVTRRYVDQFIYEKDSFLSTSPVLEGITNIRDAINALANEISIVRRTNYFFPLTQIGTNLVLSPGEEEIFAILPISVDPMNRIYMTGLNYYLPENVIVTLDVVDNPGYDYEINSGIAGTVLGTGIYYRGWNFPQDDAHLLIPNSTSNVVTRLVRIKLVNSLPPESPDIIVLPNHNISFSLYTEGDLITTTTTTTTTTTSTTTTTTAI